MNAVGGSEQAAPRRGWSVRTHLAAILAFGSVLVSVGAAYAHHWDLGQARKDAADRMTFQAQHAAASINELVATGRKAVAALAAQPGLSAVFQGAPGCTLTFDGSGAFPSARLDLVASDGTVACSSGGPQSRPAKKVHAGSTWLVAQLKDHQPMVHWSGRDAVTDQSALVISSPVLGPRHAVVGAAVIFFHLAPAGDAMARASGGSRDVRFAIADLTAHRVMSWPGASQARSILTRTAALPRSARNGTLGSGSPAVVYGSADIVGSPWRVFAGIPARHVLAGAQGALWRQMLTGLLALAMLIAAAWRLNRSVARPLKAMTAATRQASKNLGSARVAVHGTAETRELARSFNAMLDVAGGHAAQLTYQATHDALTGLPNKALLLECTEKALAAGHPVAVLTVGVNRFRLVNDALGHDVGDRVLREIAERLSHGLRPTDVVARFGSDEFVVLCSGGREDGLALADRLHHMLSEPFRGAQGDISLSAAIGLAATEAGRAATAARLLRESDTSMRQAKRSGHGVQVFDQHLQTAAETHLVLERELHQALSDGDLVLHYQPLVDIATGYVVAAEALIRWQHPQRGQIPPMDFIPLAEQTGQILAIGEFVLREACRQAASWSAGGDALVVAVNVAAAQLRTGDFPQLVEQILSETGCEARQLCLEITESSLLTTTEQRSDDLSRLRVLGVHLAIDDFGTGYSSLSYLHDLPCDELKIDRSFVSRLEDGESHLVTAIMRMAQAMDLTVVAEGVETRAQLDRLASLGCQLAQGYLFSPAVPVTEFQSLLARRHAHTGIPWDQTRAIRAAPQKPGRRSSNADRSPEP